VNGSYSPPVLSLEPGSTVKHVNWVWPGCLNSSSGEYNISIHQSFVYNSTSYYTIFNLPISITNSLDPSRNATSCDTLNNPIEDQADQSASADVLDFQPWVNGTGASVSYGNGNSSSGSGSGSGNGSTGGAARMRVDGRWMLGIVVVGSCLFFI